MESQAAIPTVEGDLALETRQLAGDEIAATALGRRSDGGMLSLHPPEATFRLLDVSIGARRAKSSMTVRTNKDTLTSIIGRLPDNPITSIDFGIGNGIDRILRRVRLAETEDRAKNGRASGRCASCPGEGDRQRCRKSGVPPSSADNPAHAFSMERHINPGNVAISDRMSQ